MTPCDRGSDKARCQLPTRLPSNWYPCPHILFGACNLTKIGYNVNPESQLARIVEHMG
jgi:hypothetical protein